MSTAASTTTEAHPGDDRHLWAQLREWYGARIAMAQLEVRHDIASTRRLGLMAGIGAVLILTGLPVLVVVLSQALAAATQIDAVWWQLVFGAGFALLGAALIFAGWRNFRREFSGFKETLDELREDQLWLGEIAAEITGSAEGATH